MNSHSIRILEMLKAFHTLFVGRHVRSTKTELLCNELSHAAIFTQMISRQISMNDTGVYMYQVNQINQLLNQL